MVKLYLFQTILGTKTPKACLTVWRLEQAGFAIQRNTIFCSLSMRHVTDDAWLEFETEEEAALFKLTYL